ncbi:polysaccharide deacetylase family protein [Algoriphagus halophytocola]|uniref:polysaccharide deacetylase family protein n=1 Tax=Algoriphagus halophytocola TaxID=2991499 RepID=UPI0022DE243E|nr:polysaccharide deacetylase family protein [Algoriphagus sp. TR-M9]WBL41962.1 polysaccharide deacetylase family protein [Algoriphagus sp. TR-M9]
MIWHTVPRLVQYCFPNRVWSKEGEGEEIYLTFDDGPVPGVTDYVLQELAKRGQKATFFMVGDNVRKHPELARAVLQAGHGIGNHTFHHMNGWKTARDQYLSDISACARIFEDKLGVTTTLFRPPYGLINPKQAQEVSENYQVIMWSMLSGDYDRSLPPERVLEKSIKHTKAGAIGLFHDQQKTSAVLPKVLPTYLDFLDERGLKTALL